MFFMSNMVACIDFCEEIIKREPKESDVLCFGLDIRKRAWVSLY